MMNQEMERKKITPKVYGMEPRSVAALQGIEKQCVKQHWTRPKELDYCHSY